MRTGEEGEERTDVQGERERSACQGRRREASVYMVRVRKRRDERQNLIHPAEVIVYVPPHMTRCEKTRRRERVTENRKRRPLLCRRDMKIRGPFLQPNQYKNP